MKRRCNQNLSDEMVQPSIIHTITQHPESILEAMEMISSSAEDSKLSDQFFEAVAIPANYLSQRLDISMV